MNKKIIAILAVLAMVVTSMAIYLESENVANASQSNEEVNLQTLLDNGDKYYFHAEWQDEVTKKQINIRNNSDNKINCNLTISCDEFTTLETVVFSEGFTVPNNNMVTTYVKSVTASNGLNVDGIMNFGSVYAAQSLISSIVLNGEVNVTAKGTMSISSLTDTVFQDKAVINGYFTTHGQTEVELDTKLEFKGELTVNYPLEKYEGMNIQFGDHTRNTFDAGLVINGAISFGTYSTNVFKGDVTVNYPPSENDDYYNIEFYEHSTNTFNKIIVNGCVYFGSYTNNIFNGTVTVNDYVDDVLGWVDFDGYSKNTFKSELVVSGVLEFSACDSIMNADVTVKYSMATYYGYYNLYFDSGNTVNIKGDLNVEGTMYINSPTQVDGNITIKYGEVDSYYAIKTSETSKVVVDGGEFYCDLDVDKKIDITVTNGGFISGYVYNVKEYTLTLSNMGSAGDLEFYPSASSYVGSDYNWLTSESIFVAKYSYSDNGTANLELTGDLMGEIPYDPTNPNYYSYLWTWGYGTVNITLDNLYMRYVELGGNIQNNYIIKDDRSLIDYSSCSFYVRDAYRAMDIKSASGEKGIITNLSISDYYLITTYLKLNENGHTTQVNLNLIGTEGIKNIGDGSQYNLVDLGSEFNLSSIQVTCEDGYHFTGWYYYDYDQEAYVKVTNADKFSAYDSMTLIATAEKDEKALPADVNYTGVLVAFVVFFAIIALAYAVTIYMRYFRPNAAKAPLQEQPKV